MTAQSIRMPAFTGEIHPFAASFPMLSTSELAELSRDIKRRGQLNPILLDQNGTLLDGRNRLAACDMAGVIPIFDMIETEEPEELILSANVNRRHMTTTQRMAARAKVAHAQGLRVVGSNGKPRWKYGAAKFPAAGNFAKTDRNAFDLCGQVADHDPALLDQIIAGRALEQVLTEIAEAKAKAEADAKAEAEARERWQLLTDHGYTERISDGQLTEAEAWTLVEKQLQAEKQLAEEHKAAVRRTAAWISAFLTGYKPAGNLHNDPYRDEVLAELGDFDRDRFLQIEKATTWPSTLI